MRTLITADIHGGYKALVQCIERSGFDKKNDRLIVLGDTCDGWPETYECMEELTQVKNLVYVLGNHDEWALYWGKFSDRPMIWVTQGGQATIESYEDHWDAHAGVMPQSHIDIFDNSHLYFEENNILFVHGGIDPQTDAKRQPKDMFLWDRTLIHMAYHRSKQKKAKIKLTPYDEVFVGHTSTKFYGTTEPMHCGNIWNLDTGAGWGGKLTIMDLDTKEYWQSDFVKDLYPNIKGR